MPNQPIAVEGNPVFAELLEKMRAMHNKKNVDYANPTAGEYYSNFEYAAMVAGGFTAPIDTVFAALIGVKMARLQELTKPGRVTNNESVDDTRLDLAVYATLWASYHESEKVRARDWKSSCKDSNRRRSTGVRGQRRGETISRQRGSVTQPNAESGGTESQQSLVDERK